MPMIYDLLILIKTSGLSTIILELDSHNTEYIRLTRLEYDAMLKANPTTYEVQSEFL